MEGGIAKKFDVPVEWRWFEVVVEHLPDHKSRRISVDSHVVVSRREEIAEDSWDEFSIGTREGPQKKGELDIEKNKKGIFQYKLKIDGVSLEGYIDSHLKRYRTFEVPIGPGAESKLIFDKESQLSDGNGEKNGSFYFRGRLIGTPKPEFDGADVVWSIKDGNFRFELRGIVEKGVQNFKLLMNGEQMKEFKPRMG